jgi:hypothetical protein
MCQNWPKRPKQASIGLNERPKTTKTGLNKITKAQNKTKMGQNWRRLVKTRSQLPNIPKLSKAGEIGKTSQKRANTLQNSSKQVKTVQI